MKKLLRMQSPGLLFEKLLWIGAQRGTNLIRMIEVSVLWMNKSRSCKRSKLAWRICVSTTEAEARQVDEHLRDPIISAEKVQKQNEVTVYSPEEVPPNLDSIPVRKPLSPKVVEYHRYLRNFHCIFLVIYAQTHTIPTISPTNLPQQAELYYVYKWNCIKSGNQSRKIIILYSENVPVQLRFYRSVCWRLHLPLIT